MKRMTRQSNGMEASLSRRLNISQSPSFQDQLHLLLEMIIEDYFYTLAQSSALVTQNKTKTKIPAPLLSEDETLFSVFACACLPSDVHAGYVELSSSWGRVPRRGFFKRSLKKSVAAVTHSYEIFRAVSIKRVSSSLLIASWKVQLSMFVWKKKYRVDLVWGCLFGFFFNFAQSGETSHTHRANPSAPKSAKFLLEDGGEKTQKQASMVSLSSSGSCCEVK